MEEIVLALFLGIVFLYWVLCRQAPATNTRRHVDDYRPRGGGAGLMKNCIPDRFETLEEVTQALRDAGLESSNLILGIDLTKSNEWNGKYSFGGRCLHDMPEGMSNPYQQVIQSMGKVLAPFDDDNLIPFFGFGDVDSKDKYVVQFMGDGMRGECVGFEQCLQMYAARLPYVRFSGPTCFAPLIRKSIEIVSEQKSYHILLIICDGQVTNVAETTAAIIEASNYPISIVCVGVGDGPWDRMREFDDNLPRRKFDNFQFCEYGRVEGDRAHARFALNCLMEIPDQYAFITKNISFSGGIWT